MTAKLRYYAAMTELAAPGLRERKNERTRVAIRRAALELTVEQGFDRTTIAEIAERADVAPRTVHTWFSSKEEIVLSGLTEPIDRLRQELETGTGSTVDRIERWLQYEGERFAGEDELGLLRMRAFAVDPRLRGMERPLMDVAEEAIATAVARDVELAPGNLAVRAFAAATVSLLLGLRIHAIDQTAIPKPDALDDGLTMLRGGLAALRDRSRPETPHRRRR
jgi:AcrR family transcriptional regulator